MRFTIGAVNARELGRARERREAAGTGLLRDLLVSFLLLAAVVSFAVTVVVLAGVTSITVIGLVALMIVVFGISVIAATGGDA
jgi:hypothetical protein